MEKKRGYASKKPGTGELFLHRTMILNKRSRCADHILARTSAGNVGFRLSMGNPLSTNI